MEQTTIRCSTCKEEKEPTSFWNNVSRWNGKDGICKTCRTEYHKKRLQARHDKRTKERYPEKVRARTLINNLVAKGKIEKLPCFICGDLKVQGHHIIYKHPEKVIWLCSAHHAEAHHG